MVDTLLTYLLHIFIGLDVLGALALFILGAKRRSARRLANSSETSCVPVHSTGFFASLRGRFSSVPAREMDRLRSVLYSFEEGLH